MQLLYQLNAQMTMLENDRPKAVAEVATDMDSKALVWRRCEVEWRAVGEFFDAVDRPR